MVFVNERKFACEACIKGHRSSSCHHTERPLFEVKRKGRPVSQCPKCRELRQEKRVHSKCTCTPRQPIIDMVPIPAARPDRKPRRFMPAVPTLPNGISDAFQLTTSSSPPNSRQKVDSLLNPCHCENVRQCTCRRSTCVAGPSSAGGTCEDYGLQALAEVAAMFRDQPVKEPADKHASDLSPRSCCSIKQPSGFQVAPSARLELPPILPGPILSAVVPDFPTMPPLSTIKSIAGSGCTCGINCTCPGCVVHRTPRYVEKHHKDCSEGCGHCVDETAGIALPDQDGTAHGGSLVDMFFARASTSTLPKPLPNLKHRRTEMDPKALAVYPNEGFANSSTEPDGHESHDAPIEVPKLECRGGCPADDACQCGQSGGDCCDGSTPS